MGFRRMPVLFSRDIFPTATDPLGYDPTGDFDRERLRNNLDSYLIPRGSYCWLDVEYEGLATDATGNKTVSWKPAQGAPHWYAPYEPGIAFWCRLLDFCKWVRPDVKFGPFGQLPHGPYRGVVNPDHRVRGWLDGLAAACRPIADRCDFLLPYFYDESTQPDPFNTLDARLEFIRLHLRRARYFFPHCEIFGMLWPEYYDLWRGRPDPDTPEHQHARLLSGYTWSRQVKTVLTQADGLMVWGGWGWGPAAPNFWKPGSEWVAATNDEFGPKRSHHGSPKS